MSTTACMMVYEDCEHGCELANEQPLVRVAVDKCVNPSSLNNVLLCLGSVEVVATIPCNTAA